jgi:hypothetical protein
VKSDDINADTKTIRSRCTMPTYRSPTSASTSATNPAMTNFCERDQIYLLKAIDKDLDLTDRMNDAVKSLKIVRGRAFNSQGAVI